MKDIFILSISPVVFVTYTIAIIILFKKLGSISQSYREFKDNYKPLFTIFCYLVALPIAITFIDSYFISLACGLLCITGSIPRYFLDLKNKLTHYVVTCLAIVSMCIGFWIDYSLKTEVLTYALAGVIVLIITPNPRKILVGEIATFLFAYYTLYNIKLA